ncbi:Peptidoglycan/LPS O-acetylase OafA/YrhL, contains acyltransferase and SGNH-hydrolase domains [Jannaschia faecimaris]|uniref:Peptidoglycan/LPS O-acetylase OafA/YrhL, contains acyltransferase and SGNH-hydrolase domains n=1 Tax=Jannaschia faecimaris TaxID=1244108 RepID=A0A1H3TVE3_9RHOB|nr:acyltransferase [Jannaschia faecimaris]SDZ54092.1 Peptidoglycan/LPS O-acetylase OafA/YrhL, contains acyltransferase and SGNH-hydrolase domains [Jannaschia faecimaris]
MTDPSDPRTHLPGLDGLRGLAVVIVLVSHLANGGMLPAVLGQGFGRLGVALFFGLSGLLMARLYLHRPVDRADLWEYAVRRCARVLPLFYAALVLGGIMALWDLQPYEQHGPQDMAWAAALVHGTGVLWSIPVEIQFYVVFAGLWWCASRGYLAAALLAALAVQAAVGLAVIATTGFGERMEHTYNLAFWMHFFAVGTMLGALSTRPAFARAFGAHGAGAALVSACLIGAIVLVPPGIRLALDLPRLPAFGDPIGAGYMLLLLIAVLYGYGLTRLFAVWPMRWLGQVSFSVYLLHMPALVMVETLLPSLAPAGQAVLVVAATLGASALSERWIERVAQRVILSRLLPRCRPAEAA